MSLYPAYMSDVWRCYEIVSREDRASIQPDLASVDTKICHASVLPFLAWEADVDISDLPEAVARDVIEAGFASLLRRGTLSALAQALQPMGDIRILEWQESGKAAYTFDARLTISVNLDLVFSRARFAKIQQTIHESKNVRSAFENLLVDLPRAEGDIHVNTALNHHSSSLGETDFFHAASGDIHASVGSAFFDRSDLVTEPLHPVHAQTQASVGSAFFDRSDLVTEPLHPVHAQTQIQGATIWRI